MLLRTMKKTSLVRQLCVTTAKRKAGLAVATVYLGFAVFAITK